MRAEAVPVVEAGPGAELETEAALRGYNVALVSASAAGIAVELEKLRARRKTLIAVTKLKAENLA